MIWQDLMVDRWVDEAALRATAVSAFGVHADAVAVVDSPEQLVATSPSVLVILERGRQYRDFPLQVLVVLRDDELARRFDRFNGALRVAARFAEDLGATVLFAEGPVSPSEWIRVHSTGQVDVVSFDVDETGDVDSFFVVGARDLPIEQRTPGKPGATRLTA